MNVDELVTRLSEQTEYILTGYHRVGWDKSKVQKLIATKLREAILETRKAQWIPVTPETMPPLDTPVDVLFKGRRRFVAMRASNEDGWCWSLSDDSNVDLVDDTSGDYSEDDVHPTHWMPLPSPPTSETLAVEGK